MSKVTEQITNKIIGKRIQELREEQKIKQDYLADILKIKRSNLSNYETGRRTIPFDILVKIAKELKTSTDYLLGTTKSKSNNIKYQSICNETALTDKSIKILKSSKNLGLINTINFLIEQEEQLLYDGFSPFVPKKNYNLEKYNKYFEKSLNAYNNDLQEIENNSIPILTTIHNYFQTKMTNEDMYIVNGTLKKKNDFELSFDRFLAEETINTNEIVENTFLEKIKNKLIKAKQKYSKRKENRN